MDKFEELTIERLNSYFKESDTKYHTAHNVLCFAIIKRIYRRVMMGYRFGGITVCEYKGIVVDGNHRYIAYLLAGVEIEFICGTSSHCDLRNCYKDIRIDTKEDWDYNSPSYRKYCNDKILESYTKLENNEILS